MNNSITNKQPNIFDLIFNSMSGDGEQNTLKTTSS